jgi:glucosamine--fructose-6-phosphate aminotransferase (isomerizing)
VISLNQQGIKVHPLLEPYLVLQRFYLDVAKEPLSRGFNPDEPKGLKKVTRTL